MSDFEAYVLIALFWVAVLLMAALVLGLVILLWKAILL